LIASAFTLGMPEALTYFGSQGRLTRRTAVAALGVLVGCGAVGGLAALAVSRHLSAGNDDLREAIVAVSLLAIPALFVVGLRGWAQARQQWALIATERFAGSLMRLVLIGVLFATVGLSPGNASIALGITLFAGGVVYLGLRSPVVTLDSNGMHRFPASMGEVQRYGFRAWLGAVAGILLMRVDQLLLTPLAGLDELGYYVVAVNVAEVSLVFNAAVREVIFARQARRVDDAELSRASRISTVVTIVCALFLAAAAPIGLPVAFGSEFSASLWPMMILMLGIVVGNPGSVVGAGLAACGRPELRSFSLICALVVNVVCLLVLAPSFGAVGAALATVIGNAISGGLNVYFYSRLRQAYASDFILIRPRDLADTWAMARNVIRK
jgi:O-antigen/teichoic acid export membrane protein